MNYKEWKYSLRFRIRRNFDILCLKCMYVVIFFIKEMKRKVGNVFNIEELEDDDLYNSDEDDEDIGNFVENLKVFCVSVIEY